MRRTWVEVAGGLVPAYIVKKELKGPYEDYLQIHNTLEPKPVTRKKNAVKFNA